MTEHRYVVVTDRINEGVAYTLRLAGPFVEIQSGFASSTRAKLVFLDADGNKATAVILTPYDFKELKLKGEVHWDVSLGNPPDKSYRLWVS